MDIKRKQLGIRTWTKHLFLDISSTNTDTRVPSLDQCVETRSKKSFNCCLSHFPISISTSSSSAKPLPPRWNRFTRHTLLTINRKHLFMNILCIESFCTQRKHNRTSFFGSTLLKHNHHFDYWNQALNTSVRVCYLDCHEAGLCCYLVIHIENLLHPLQLFYIHLCPIYWLSGVHSRRYNSSLCKLKICRTL
jgi:hypothetical protein